MTGEEHIIYLKNLRTALKLANNFSNETMESLNKAIEVLEQEPCEDAISRKWVLDVVNNFVFDTETDRNRIIHIIRDTAPSVTPKQKTGKWKLVQIGKSIDICCCNCKAVRFKEYAYNYTIDELNKSEDFKEFLKHPNMRYCPCCGVEMENGE